MQKSLIIQDISKILWELIYSDKDDYDFYIRKIFNIMSGLDKNCLAELYEQRYDIYGDEDSTNAYNDLKDFLSYYNIDIPDV
jgi:hypothetical protein